MSTRIEDEVREALWRSTDTLSTPPDAYARVMDVVDAHRRRRRATVAAGTVAAALLAGFFGVSTGTVDVRNLHLTPTTERVVDRVPSWGFQADWPARGPLATDEGFTDEFTRLYGTEHRLLYAEDGAAGRVVIAVSASQEAVLFTGPSGADLAALQRIPGPRITTRDVAVAVPEDGGHLIVVAMPKHLTDAWISIPAVARDGSVSRSWEQIPVADGIGRAFATDPIGVVRLETSFGDGPLHIVVGGERPGMLDCKECDSDWFADGGLAQFREKAAAVVRADVTEVAAEVVMDAPAQGGRVAVLVATLPSGGLVRGSYFVADESGAPTLTMLEPLRPLPAGDQNRPVFVRRGAVRGIGEALLIAPGASRVSFTPVGANVPAIDEVNLTTGVGTMTTAPGDLGDYRLTAYGEDGRVLRTWHGTALRATDPFRVSPSDGRGRTG